MLSSVTTTAGLAAGAALAVSLLSPTNGTAPQAVGPQALAASSSFPLADPDTVRADDGRYVTYGTTVGAGTGKRCSGDTKPRLRVPYLVHGSGNNVGMANCATGNALAGLGSWAEQGSAVWAPGVAKFGGKHFMYFTATRAGSGQKCIGVATSTSGARGPFKNARAWACPPAGRWAIDADPFVAGGKLYVTYRDDAIASGNDTGISTVRADSNGNAVWNTRRSILKSTDVTWETRGATTKNIVENPSMWKAHDGLWYVMYSGNKWDSARYATGIARCGSTPLPATRCTPVKAAGDNPYFGFKGSGDINPYRALPGNHKGPGGMSVFNAADGSRRVVWHWWESSTGRRYPMTGVLTRGSTGFKVS